MTRLMIALGVTSLLLLLYATGTRAFPRPSQNASAVRLVYSMTTNPQRIFGIWQTINSLLNQGKWMPDLIQVNVPWVFLRTNETFQNLDSIEILKHPLVKVHRCHDYGPITKLAGALETERDPETLIVVVDDDWKYPFYMTEFMKKNAAAEPDFAVVGHCGDSLITNPESDFYLPPFSDYRVNARASPCCCRFLEGFGGVGYRVRFFQNASAPVSWGRYLDVALQHRKCYRTDDLTLSNYLALQGIQAVLFAPPIKVWPTKANVDQYALSKQKYEEQNAAGVKVIETSHPYHNCSLYLQSHNISSALRTIVPAEERVNMPAPDGALLQCASERTVYLIQNNTRRAFQSGQAFMAMGFEFGSVKRIVPGECQWELFWMPEGPNIF